MANESRLGIRKALFTSFARHSRGMRHVVAKGRPYSSILDILKAPPPSSAEDLDRAFRSGLLAIMEASNKNHLGEEERNSLLKSFLAAYSEARLTLMLEGYLNRDTKEGIRGDMSLV